MWRERISTVVVLAMAAGLGGIAPAARAQTPGDPVFGDVDGDGFRDRIFLGTIQPGQCSVVVQYGRPDNVLLPPVAYAYLRPGGTLVSCPDIGVAVDLTQNGFDDLVIGWSGGPPPSITQNLLVLSETNFQPSFGITTFVSRPRYMGQADFNGDGRPDVYALSSRDRGMETYYSLGDGTLTVGPMRWCAEHVDVQFKDFDRDLAAAALVTYTGACADDSNGVVKVSHTGGTQLLQHDPAGVRQWRARVAYLNGDGLADVRTLEPATGEVEYFIQAPGSRPAYFVQSPKATYDRVTVRRGRVTTIPVLDNDLASTGARITILTPPGTARPTSPAVEPSSTVRTPHTNSPTSSSTGSPRAPGPARPP